MSHMAPFEICSDLSLYFQELCIKVDLQESNSKNSTENSIFANEIQDIARVNWISIRHAPVYPRCGLVDISFSVTCAYLL